MREFPPRLRLAGPARAEAEPRQRRPGRLEGRGSSWRRRLVRVLHARRGSVPEELPLGDFLRRCEVYFDDGGCIIDQPFQPRLPDGMIRCYMAGDKVVGLRSPAHQGADPAAAGRPGLARAQPGPRIMHPPDAPPVPGAADEDGERMDAGDDARAGHRPRSLPVLWDADFLYGPRTASGDDTYVLCEINVSSVIPFPATGTGRSGEADAAPAGAIRAVIGEGYSHGRSRRPASPTLPRFF